MKKIGLGIMRCEHLNPNDTAELVKKTYDLGIDYFESASFYLNWNCEEILGNGISTLPRDKINVCAKLCNLSIDDKHFITQLKNHHTNYFDTYLIQGINRNRLPSNETIDFLLKKKEQGIIKQLGFSFHDDVDTIKKVFDIYPDWDCIQLKINYHDWFMNLGIQDVYNYVYEKKIPITVMAPLNGGIVANMKSLESVRKNHIPEWTAAQIALRFFNTLPGVDRVLLGATSVKELKEDIEALQSNGFTKKEYVFCKLANEVYRKSHKIDCTKCRYCETVCPQHITISKYFEEYNKVMNGEDNKKYIKLSSSHQIDCIGCGKCERICPQHLDIRKYLHEYLYQTRV